MPCPEMNLLQRPWAWGLMLLAAVPAAAQDNNAPGVVRITKPAATVRGQSDEITPGGVIPAGKRDDMIIYAENCPEAKGGKHKGRMGRFTDTVDAIWCNKPGAQCFQCRGNTTGTDMSNYFLCKFGYFIPSGNGGAGAPFAGCYSRVYPQDPNYFDQRDGQIWGAQGYGVPIAVPLAPVVGHQYNYSWGTPASRLTPISHIAPY